MDDNIKQAINELYNAGLISVFAVGYMTAFIKIWKRKQVSFTFDEILYITGAITGGSATKVMLQRKGILPDNIIKS